MSVGSRWILKIVLMVLSFWANPVFAQKDSTDKISLDSFLLRQKGLIGNLAENLVTDTTEDKGLIRTDRRFQRHNGKSIRHIYVQVVKFGVSIRDTSKRVENTLIRLSNNLHRQTRHYVIRNNLFFREKDKVSAFLLADNEKHLRDLDFLQDAYISVRQVQGHSDSVDVIVNTKDVFSIGGSAQVYNIRSARIAVKEDNFMGWGDRMQLQTMVDFNRDRKFGYGMEYIRRNINGSFVDASVGILNFNSAFSSGKREENLIYFHAVKPLVNRYMKWTYGAKFEFHDTNNFYHSDSLYQNDFRYKYNFTDGWLTWNMDADFLYGGDNENRLRRLAGIRYFRQHFQYRPDKYEQVYNYRYADMQAGLASFSIYRQNPYKTQYIYGFGRNEDVPEGMEASVTAGWTRIDTRSRPYVGLSFQRNYFSRRQHYFDYALRVGSYFYKGNFEDIALLASMEYFTPIQKLGNKWKQRLFLNVSTTKLVNSLLQEPLLMESRFGLPEFANNFQLGDTRLTLKAESVFFSPWNLFFFKFAPFVFANGSVFNQNTSSLSEFNLYSALGGGLRIRNESLIFGTMELRGMYFPRKNYNNDSWRIEFNTNIRFKYNQELVKRPELLRVNF